MPGRLATSDCGCATSPELLFPLQTCEVLLPAVPCDFQLDFVLFPPSSSSIRQYELVVHTDVNMNKVYTGEMGRLKSYENQKP